MISTTETTLRHITKCGLDMNCRNNSLSPIYLIPPLFDKRYNLPNAYSVYKCFGRKDRSGIKGVAQSREGIASIRADVAF
jgi:hypothetical protein